MDRLTQYEQRIRAAIAGVDAEVGFNYEVHRTEQEVILKLNVPGDVTKQRLWELWQGDWPAWKEISSRVPLLRMMEIEWDGTSFSLRIRNEFLTPFLK